MKKKLVTALATFALLQACSSSTASSGSDDGGSISPPGTSSGSASGGSSSGAGTSSGNSSGGATGGGSSSGSGSGGSGDSGASSADGGGREGGAVSGANAKLVLTIPGTFTGTTRELDVVLVKSLPVAGPPSSVLYQQKNPVVTAGESLTINASASGVNGAYYVVAVLYMQGGGGFSPSAGIDYEAQTTGQMTFTGGSIDLGTLALTLVPADGGP